MKLSATFSPCRKYRYRLARIWREEIPPLVWIMLNPSTADELSDDPTIHKCIGYSMNLGFGGCVIHNLFAWRSTDPKALLLVADPVGPGNDEMIIGDLQNGRRVICAWGKLRKPLLWRISQVASFLAGRELEALAKNKDGSPAHPLYLSFQLKPQKWELP